MAMRSVVLGKSNGVLTHSVQKAAHHTLTGVCLHATLRYYHVLVKLPKFGQKFCLNAHVVSFLRQSARSQLQKTNTDGVTIKVKTD